MCQHILLLPSVAQISWFSIPMASSCVAHLSLSGNRFLVTSSRSFCFHLKLENRLLFTGNYESEKWKLCRCSHDHTSDFFILVHLLRFPIKLGGEDFSDCSFDLYFKLIMFINQPDFSDQNQFLVCQEYIDSYSKELNKNLQLLLSCNLRFDL